MALLKGGGMKLPDIWRRNDGGRPKARICGPEAFLCVLCVLSGVIRSPGTPPFTKDCPPSSFDKRVFSCYSSSVKGRESDMVVRLESLSFFAMQDRKKARRFLSASDGE